ncbi:MAG: response regulator [Gemmatimonadetes bacterium]|nr:response regulator [Gemmatimonadota bacterium]
MAAPLKILVAEDEPLSAMALQAQLEAMGHTVIGPARDGRQAVDLATANPLDLALLDVRMPRLSGLEAADEIFRIRHVPIIMLSGYSDPELVDRASKAPVFHYLVKPVSMQDLGPAITVALNRFQEWQAFQDEAHALEQKLEDRKLVEKAKGVLMAARGLSEADAYRVLQKESQNRNQPMVEIARSVIMTDSLLRDHA